MSEQLLVCKALAAMFRKHGEPKEEEVTFVAHSAFELALTPEQNEEVQRVLKEGGELGSFIEGINSRAMRTYLFRRVVAATLLDENIEDHEMAIIGQTARAFGFDTRAVEEYLAWMNEGIAWEKRGAAIAARL